MTGLRRGVAAFRHGQWCYGRNVATTRGTLLKWLRSASFSQDELDSAHFVALRAAFNQQDDPGTTTAAVVAFELDPLR